jgi:hypothetical protein
MRKEVLEGYQDYYKLSKGDIENIFNFVVRTTRTRLEHFNNKVDKIEKDEPELFDDVVDDLTYYHYMEESFLWESCLWRIQGVLEGIVVQQYLEPSLEISDLKKLKGFKNKLDKLKNLGFKYNQAAYVKLLDWNDLRNRISHLPPRKYTQVLGKQDIVEYKRLVESFLNSIEK